MNNTVLCTPMALRLFTLTLSSLNTFCQSSYIFMPNLNTAHKMQRSETIWAQRPVKDISQCGPLSIDQSVSRFRLEALVQGFEAEQCFIQYRPDQSGGGNHCLQLFFGTKGQELRHSCCLSAGDIRIWPIWWVFICLLIVWLAVVFYYESIMNHRRAHDHLFSQY